MIFNTDRLEPDALSAHLQNHLTRSEENPWPIKFKTTLTYELKNYRQRKIHRSKHRDF
jgi:hypothetical protein